MNIDHEYCGFAFTFEIEVTKDEVQARIIGDPNWCYPGEDGEYDCKITDAEYIGEPEDFMWYIEAFNENELHSELYPLIFT